MQNSPVIDLFHQNNDCRVVGHTALSEPVLFRRSPHLSNEHQETENTRVYELLLCKHTRQIALKNASNSIKASRNEHSVRTSYLKIKQTFSTSVIRTKNSKHKIRGSKTTRGAQCH